VNGARDRNQVRRLYEQHGRALLAYACAFLHDPSEAEDVLHQVFLQLLRDGATEISSPGYLFRAVRNRVVGQMTFEEVAGVVGISPNTAASRYRYGLEKLTEVWHGRT
jgi:DNA-directed RNA polymerase specialized sigma24 family protein